MEKQPSALARAWDSLAPVVSSALAFDRLAPARTALFVIDLNRGFAEKGALFSPLCRALLPGVAGLLRRAKETGVETLLFTDTHTPDSPEFTSYPAPLCERHRGRGNLPGTAAGAMGPRYPQSVDQCVLGTGFLAVADGTPRH